MRRRPAPAGAIIGLLFLLLPGCSQQYDPRDAVPDTAPLETGAGGLPLDSLKGTVWVWDSPWGERRLTFDSSDMAVSYLGQDGDDYTEPYTYDGAAKTGTITYYAEAGFQISADNQAMYITEWKNYGHGCEYARRGASD